MVGGAQPTAVAPGQRNAAWERRSMAGARGHGPMATASCGTSVLLGPAEAERLLWFFVLSDHPGEHSNALFGEGIRQIPASAATGV